ncbi:MAG: SDR family NAD(P)-dependent oxidoreductase [Planctomycetota bacterium]|nr:MAG: SDR family NAD(P)-dependent oxidoreductase [Planctomycetota bacterium]
MVAPFQRVNRSRRRSKPMEIGSWIGNGSPATWTPTINPAMVQDPGFPELLASAQGGVSFADACVLVTGASAADSIGYAVARNFLRGGAKVVITGSRNLEAISATAEQIMAECQSGSVLPAQVNQGDLADIDAFLAGCKEQGIAFSHLYPFAAINHPALFVGIKPEDYARVFAVNTFGVYHLAVRHARAIPRGAAYYVCIPLSPNDGRLQGSGLYPASKQALRPLVVQGQHEYGDRRNGTYTGIDIAWTRSALMSGLDGGVAAAREAGLIVYETSDTADCCTLLGTPAAAAYKGRSLDASGGFGSVEPQVMAEVLKAMGH